MKNNFMVLQDTEFSKINTDAKLQHVENKFVVSFVNEFEEGVWRYSKFQEYIWDKVIQTSLSQKERSELVDNHYSALISAAKNLRLTDKDTVGEGSEIAEIVLYGICLRRNKVDS